MSNRITETDLQITVDSINRLLNTDKYCLYHANGGVGLHVRFENSSGVSTIFYLSTKRELFNKLQAFIAGIYAKEVTK